MVSAIELLPKGDDIKPLKGYKNLFRLRVGDYRGIYSGKKEITVPCSTREQISSVLPISRTGRISQTLYKILALVMLFVGGLAANTFVWDLGDFGVGLMTIFNMTALIPMAPQAVQVLKDYEKGK